MKAKLLGSMLFLLGFALVMMARAHQEKHSSKLEAMPVDSISLQDAADEKVDAPMQLHAKPRDGGESPSQQ